MQLTIALHKRSASCVKHKLHDKMKNVRLKQLGLRILKCDNFSISALDAVLSLTAGDREKLPSS